MTVKKFFLCGDSTNTAVELDISAVNTLDELQRSVAAHYGVVQAEGLAFQAGETELTDLSQVASSKHHIGITVDGHSVRDVPGPQGLPYVGNYFEGKYATRRCKCAQVESNAQSTRITSATTSDCSTNMARSSSRRTWGKRSARLTIP